MLPHEKTAIRPAEETPTVVWTSTEVDAFTPGAVLGGRYRIVSLLGRGGMGEVYRADDLRLGQPVALKFLSRHTKVDEQLLHDEVRIGRQVSHPNVCRLYDIEEVDGRVFIAMEYVDGEDLAALLRRVGRFAPDKALGVARDLCAGLAAAHELGVIHRDLKPANVLIDGRGRARVTDFGLAVEHDRAQVAAGTPAYMAPEQLSGHRATMQSDLYSLGLLLYEIFTGRRAIEATSLAEIAQQQREQRFLRPSAVIPDMDPAVETAILRCLDPDPHRRPVSVHELVRELPGFDPVAAALAAGETPSAGLIAASTKKGDLAPRVAWSLLALAILGLVVAAATAPLSMLVSGSSVKPTEVLIERAREVLATAGITAKPHDRGFSHQENYVSRRAPFEFIYRESPEPMVSHDLLRRVTSKEPPLVLPEMSLVRLDPTGMLIEFAVVPPSREEAWAQASVDWSKFIALAGVDPAMLIPAKPERTARSDSDAKQAWTLRGSDMRIEAASYHGRPVWFAVIEPARQIASPGVRRGYIEAPRPGDPADSQLASIVELVLVLILPMTALFLAWRNFRRGSSDRRGAFRLALIFFIDLFLSTLLRMHHSSGVTLEWLQLSLVVAETAFISAVIGLSYLAIEPLVRRRWPSMLISWSRLLVLRWRDPMVGRDVLIGVVCGIGIGVAQRMTAIVPQWLGARTEPLWDLPMESPAMVGSFLLHALLVSIYKCVFAIILVLLVRALVKRLDVAIAVSAILSVPLLASDGTGPMEVRIAYGVLVAAVVYAVLFRFGLLALVSTGYVATVLFYVPLTPDTSSWFFPRTLLVLLFLGALAAFGFYTSLAGKRWLPRLSM